MLSRNRPTGQFTHLSVYLVTPSLGVHIQTSPLDYSELLRGTKYMGLLLSHLADAWHSVALELLFVNRPVQLAGLAYLALATKRPSAYNRSRRDKFESEREVITAKLTDEAKKAIGEIRPLLVATASETGKPNVSAKGAEKREEALK